MIHVKRPRTAPRMLRGDIAAKEMAAAERAFAKQKSAERLPFKLYMHPDVRAVLNELFHGKCAYCESFYGSVSPVDLEHHRPKRLAMNLDGSVAPDHYWWLTNEWANLLPSCGECNRTKGTRFPIAGERAPLGARGRQLTKERPYLLDPCVDEPSQHLVFLDDGLVAGLTERGEVTIDVLALNRSGLLKARQSAIAELSLEVKAISAAAAAGDDDTVARLTARAFAADRPYAGMRHQLVHTALSEAGVEAPAPDVGHVTHGQQEEAVERAQVRARVKQSYSVEHENPEEREVFFAGKKWIEWIEIENFKAITRLELAFPSPQNTDREPWLMLLGTNGTGKSSVLQAVALALMGERHAAELGLDASRFVRRGAKRGSGRVRVKLATIPEPIEVQFKRKSSDFVFMTGEPKVLLLAYGATRLLRQRDPIFESGPQHVRIKNLFDPTAPLSDVESWLLDRSAVDDARFDAIAAALKDLLLLQPEDRFMREKDHVEVIVNGEDPVDLDQLSDGFQSVVALSADVMKSLFERFPSMQEAEGIVLLDEIEAHLHPSWRIEIVERLRRTFPKVAFLVTTHDPLCLKGLQEGEIVVLQRDENHRIEAITNVPPVNDLRADQILTSPLFGLHSTRGDEATDAIARYSELLGRKTLTPEEELELEQLRERLSETITTQESPGQREVEQRLVTAIEDSAPPQGAAFAPPQADGAPRTEELELRRQLDELLKGPAA